MTVQIAINNSTSAAARYLTWAWCRCRIRVTNPVGILGPTASVQLSQTVLAGGGSIRFSTTPSGAGSPTLTLNVPANGTSVFFFVRGLAASIADPGVRITARWKPFPLAPFQTVGTATLMVRVRKNAATLTTGERDRFVAALATLNNMGLGRYADIRAVHVSGAASAQAHGAAGFLPWHRVYLLDLERELQNIDPSVTLPYWRWDLASPSIFTQQFLGQENGTSPVIFSASNPLQFWQTDGIPGIVRDPTFNTSLPAPVAINQAATLALGTNYAAFRAMEGNPHASAHTRFLGPVSSVPTAPRDPLFFLLHCNVDRLWALWQRNNSRFNPSAPGSYDPAAQPLGHNLGDTMWPWNNVTTPPRPPVAPGGTLAPSPITTVPGPSPRVQDCFDYQGALNFGNAMGFSYDDVPL